jgi:hypothetical protein
MADQGCVIIDDVDEALEATSEVGRAIVENGARLVQEAVKALASKRGWIVVPYGAYRRWLTDLSERREALWASMDPLLDAPAFTAIRCSRRHAMDARAQYTCADLPETLWERPFSLADDAASSGNTIRHVIGLAAKRQSRVEHVAVCAASASARQNVLSLRSGCTWMEYVPGDNRVIHLRDGCPYLPFAGRTVATVASPAAERYGTDLRVLPATITANLWQAVWLDAPVRAATTAAVEGVIAGLLNHLDREPLISDVPELGSNVGALVNPGSACNSGMPLRGLWT